jgi:ribosomal-protein-alanine N-acetyltransferase
VTINSQFVDGFHQMTHIRTRPLSLADVGEWTALELAEREFMAPYKPVRGDAYFTEDAQRGRMRDELRQCAEGTLFPRFIITDEGAIAGAVTLKAVERGWAQFARLGYWVAQGANGRGLATEAVGEILATAFTEMGLHRIQADIMPDNVRSRRVLEKNGFVKFGTAREAYFIGGGWRDHDVFQRLSLDPPIEF